MNAPAGSATPRLLRSDHGNYWSARFSRDGQTLLVITGVGVIETIDAHSGSQDGRIYAWYLQKRHLIAVSPPRPADVDTLVISTNGWVIFAGFGKDVQRWNPDTRQLRHLAAARPTSNLILGPDGMSIIFGTACGAIEFWDVRTEQRLHAMNMPGA